MKKILFLLFVMSVSVFVAQTNEELFDKANAQYKEGNYQEAINLYTQIESESVASSALYFNLGNCYYKLNNVANTIYNYEKALILDPLNNDASNNLEFARRMTIDNIEELPKTFLQRIEINYIKKFSYNQWSVFATVFSFLFALLFILFYISKNSNKKRIYFLTSMFSLLFLIVTVVISYNQYSRFINTKTGIIFSSKVDVHNAPTLNSDEIFILHEGTKIFILDSVDNWKKIKLADGKIGWISADALKEL